MRAAGLVDAQRKPVTPELFWELVTRWRPDQADVHDSVPWWTYSEHRCPHWSTLSPPLSRGQAAKWSSPAPSQWSADWPARTRATSDVDIANGRSEHEPAQLTLLLASDAEVSGASDALVPTPAGNVQVDVLEVTDAELARLPDDSTDRPTCSPTPGPQLPQHP